MAQTSIHQKSWTKLDVSPAYLDDPSPFPPEDSSSSESPLGESKQVDLYKIMKKARSDREKLSYAAQYVVRYPGRLEDLESRLDRYLNLLDYEASRREFLSVRESDELHRRYITTNPVLYTSNHWRQHVH